jgi:hypothetical protein
MKDSGLLLTTEKIYIITRLSQRQCEREMAAIRKHSGKTDKQRLIDLDAAKFYGMTLQEYYDYIDGYRRQLKEKNQGDE